MSKVRDRFDAGKQAQHDADKRAHYVQQGTQDECARYQIRQALAALDAGVASPFALDLVAEYFGETGNSI